MLFNCEETFRSWSNIHICNHDNYFWEVEMTTALSWQKWGLFCCSEWLALNVYVALCYCNMDFYDVSLEILDMYLQVGHHDKSCWMLHETVSIVKLTTLTSALTSTLFQIKVPVPLLCQVHPDSPLAVNVKVQFVISSLAVLMCLYVHFLEMSQDLDICTDQL